MKSGSRNSVPMKVAVTVTTTNGGRVPPGKRMGKEHAKRMVVVHFFLHKNAINWLARLTLGSADQTAQMGGLHIGWEEQQTPWQGDTKP